VLGTTASYALVGDAIAGLSIGSNGSWSFDPANAAYDYLAKDQTLDITVTYSVTDNNGASDTASFTITVTGTNDAPVATFSTAQSATEGGSSITGQLTSTDLDVLGTTASYALVGDAIAGLSIGSNGSW
jgi:VCBS repeat-containing protein